MRKTILLPIKAAAGTAVTGYACPADATTKWKVLGFAEAPNAAIAADDTDYVTLTPSVGSTGIATARTSKVTGGAARVAGTPVNWTLTGVGAQLEVSQAAPFKFAVTHSGSGKAIDTNFMLEVEVLRY